MSEIGQIQKTFEKTRLLRTIQEIEDKDEYMIGVHRFGKLTILSKLIFKDENKLR